MNSFLAAYEGYEIFDPRVWCWRLTENVLAVSLCCGFGEIV